MASSSTPFKLNIRSILEDCVIYSVRSVLSILFFALTTGASVYRLFRPAVPHPVAKAFHNKIIGHRAGVAFIKDDATSLEDIVPENTLASFRHAAQEGIRIVEFDVRMSSDGVPVVFHDIVVTCTLDTPAEHREKPLSSFLLSEIQSFELLSSVCGTKYKEERIPTLRQTLELCSSLNLFMMIEIKQEGPMASDCARETAILIRELGLQSRCYVASFFPQILHAIRSIDTSICTGFLYAASATGEICKEFARQGKPIPMLLRNRIVSNIADWTLRQLGRPSLLSVLGHSIAAVDAQFVSHHLVKQYASYGITVLAWTVNHPTQQRFLFESLEVSVISDTPLRELKEKSNLALDQWVASTPSSSYHS